MEKHSDLKNVKDSVFGNNVYVDLKNVKERSGLGDEYSNIMSIINIMSNCFAQAIEQYFSLGNKLKTTFTNSRQKSVSEHRNRGGKLLKKRKTMKKH